ncbi:hypothetical protein [Variovorax sp. LjRoot178]|uniref:hypothetical protein n=1 Tax=Variovorax sp. LjRoot178 TaxID=3342277 RepID=UPI003ECCB234
MLLLLLDLLPFFAPFLALLAFMVWDRKRMGRPKEGSPSTLQARGGWEGRQKWQLWAGMGCVAAAMGAVEWMNPKRPPFSGRWGWLETLAHSQFGQGGIAWIWFAAGAMLFAAAFISRD